MVFKPAFLLLYGDAGPVSYELVGTRKCVEQCGFAAVGVTRKSYSDLFVHDGIFPSVSYW